MFYKIIISESFCKIRRKRVYAGLLFKQNLWACNFLEKKTNRVQVFSSEFGVIYDTKLFTDHFWATYSVVRDLFITISLTYNDS